MPSTSPRPSPRRSTERTSDRIGGHPRRASHPALETGLIEEARTLTGWPDRDLTPNRRDESAIEGAAREGAHDLGSYRLDQLVALAAHVQRGRPVEEDGLRPVLDRHARSHVEDDRDRHAVGVGRRQPVPFEEAPSDLRALDLEAHRVPGDPGQGGVVQQGCRPENPTVEGETLPCPDRRAPAISADRMPQQVLRQHPVRPRPERCGDVVLRDLDASDPARKQRRNGQGEPVVTVPWVRRSPAPTSRRSRPARPVPRTDWRSIRSSSRSCRRAAPQRRRS